jgi:hypothetical protein
MIRPMTAQRFTTTTRDGGRGRVLIPVPFDPDQAWRPKARHLVGGTVNDRRVRGAIERHAGEWAMMMGPMWSRDCGVGIDEQVTVELVPEGPQRDDLPEDVAAALEANPQAAAFYDTLAQFYRKAYLRWIEGTKRRPEVRAERIAEVVRLLEASVKERTQP